MKSLILAIQVIHSALLISNDIGINITASEYKIPMFHAAVILNNPAYMQNVLSHDKTLVKTPTESWGGSTPLYFATKFNSYEALELLLQNGATVNDDIDKHQTKALHIAAATNHVKIAELLIEKGAEIDSLDDLKCTPLLYAISTQSYDVAKLLLDKGADKLLKNVYLNCPYGIAQDDQKMLDIFKSYRKSNK